MGSIWSAGSQSTLAAMVIVAALLCLVVMVLRAAALRPVSHRDRRRKFRDLPREEMLARAGGRCEHHGLTGRRCEERIDLQVDHIRPHSKGGPTIIENGAVLCAWHNMRKGARVPYDWELRRLERFRADYFPPGVSTAVTRRPTPDAFTTRRGTVSNRRL